MPEIDVVDSTWICTRPGRLAAIVAEPANWRRWWPELELAVDEWRGDKGVRWTVRSALQKRAAGSQEIWLETCEDGVVLHYFLRLDGIDGPLSRRVRARAQERIRRQTKRTFWVLGDQLDPGRLSRVSSGIAGR